MPADGVVTGHASVMGRPVYIASQDFTVGWLRRETHNIKVTETMESALMNGAPFIFINDSGGARGRRASTHRPATARSRQREVVRRRAADLDHRRPLRRWCGTARR